MLPLFLLVSTVLRLQLFVSYWAQGRRVDYRAASLSFRRWDMNLCCPGYDKIVRSGFSCYRKHNSGALFMRNNGILSWLKKKITFYSITKFLWIIYKSLAHVHVTKMTRLKELATAANNCHCQHNDCSDFRFSVTVSSCFLLGKFCSTQCNYLLTTVDVSRLAATK